MKKGARPLAEYVPPEVRAALGRHGLGTADLALRWPEIVGARIARVCEPEALTAPRGRPEGGTLTLRVEGAHALDIQHMAPVILDRVNAHAGYPCAKRIAIRQAPLAPRRGKPERATPQEPAANLEEALRRLERPYR